MELWTYEQEAWAQGCETVCGVDESGRDGEHRRSPRVGGGGNQRAANPAG